MGDAADDARDTEEMWANLRWAHKNKQCGLYDDCPYCDEDFEPLFAFQRLED